MILHFIIKEYKILNKREIYTKFNFFTKYQDEQFAINIRSKVKLIASYINIYNT